MKLLSETTIAICLAALLALILDLPTTQAADARSTSFARLDQELVEKTAIGGLAGIEMARLAERKASSRRVKRLAQTLVTDQTAWSQAIEKLAAQRKSSMPTELDPFHRQKLEQLRARSGPDFDRAYLRSQIDGHERMYALLAMVASSAKDAELRALASKTLPRLEERRENAKALQVQVTQN